MTTTIPEPRASSDPSATPGLHAASITSPVNPRIPPAITQKRLNKLLVHAGLLLICTGFLLPFFWMISPSLNPLDQPMAFPPRFTPQRIDFYHFHENIPTPLPQNYYDVITSERFDFPRFSRNTLIVAS